MIGEGSERVKSLTSIIGKTVIKLVSIFPKLHFLSQLKAVIRYLIIVLHMKSRFSSEKFLIGKTILEILPSIFLKYLFYVFIVIHSCHYFCYHYSFSNFCHCLVTIILLRSLFYYFIN